MTDRPPQSEEQDRRARLDDLRAHEVNPYPDDISRTHRTGAFLSTFDTLLASQEEVIVSGRLRALRRMGAMSFLRLEDADGSVQLVLRKNDLSEAVYIFFLDHVDVGDIVECRGKAYLTKTGERSVFAASIRILAKSIRPLPEKWHGLQDTETRYRRRELDLLSHPEVRERFIMRSRLVSGLRRFLDEHGFLEVETPILQPIPGGASARPFITHHNALDTDLYLRIAPELYLKRLIVGGFEKIYEIGRCFRNEGIDYSHNPEFTMMELYWAYVDKDEYISFLEELLVYAIQDCVGTLTVGSAEDPLNFTSPWPRKTFREVIQEACGIDIDECRTPEALMAAVASCNLSIDFTGCIGIGEYYDQLFKKTARPLLKQPMWIFDYPAELKPLTKRHPVDPTKSASAQLVVNGAELINAYYHELNDPIDQRNRLMDQQNLRDQGSEEAQWLDEEFLQSLEQGMPPTAGVGVGIDRFIAVLTNADTLKEVILFPTLRPQPTSSQEQE